MLDDIVFQPFVKIGSRGDARTGRGSQGLYFILDGGAIPFVLDDEFTFTDTKSFEPAREISFEDARCKLVGEGSPGFRLQQRYQVKLFLALRQVDAGAGLAGVGTGGRPHQVAVGDQNRVGAGLRPPGQLLLRPLRGVRQYF